MKKVLTYFFVTMGVVFTLILIGLAYLWFADPLGIRPFLQPPVTNPETGEVVASTTTTATTPPAAIDAAKVESPDQNPHLTPAQEDALSLIGIDPAGLPETLTPTQMECFVRVLGAERVAEIQAGDAPTPLEVLQGEDCVSY